MTEELSADVIRGYRQDAGLSIAEAARELRNLAPNTLPGLDSIVRTWKRWEAGTRPSRAYRPMLGTLLAQQRTDAAAAAAVVASVDLSGEWWASWQTWRHGMERFSPQSVRIRQAGTDLKWWAVTRGVPVDDGGYLWSGELRLWDNEILMGWYAAEDGSVRSKGSVYFRLHPHGQVMEGRWTGLSHDGPTVTGLGVMARAREETLAAMRRLVAEERGSSGTDR